MGMEVLMIPGNHDMEDYSGGPHALEPFGFIKGCTIAMSEGAMFADRLVVAIPLSTDNGIVWKWVWATWCPQSRPC